MKKILTLATAAFLITGVSYADGVKKGKAKKATCNGKTCSKEKKHTSTM